MPYGPEKFHQSRFEEFIHVIETKLQVVVSPLDEGKNLSLEGFQSIKVPHSTGFFLAYLSINLVPKRTSNILYLTENNLDIFAIVEKKMDSFFFDNQSLSMSLKKPYG